MTLCYALSLPQVKAINRGETVGAGRAPELEVTNYLKAMRWIEQNSKAEIDEDAVFNLHRIITRETRELHSVLACAIIHHRFVSIHPFSDGNGRLARALGTLLLYQRDFDLHHIFSLDEFFAGDRRRYYEKLQQARELDDNLTFWIEYVAEGVVATLKKVRQRIEDLQVTASYPVNLSPRQEETLRLLRDSRSLHVSELMRELKVSRARINQLLTPLISGGIVVKEGESRATRYRLNFH